MTNTKNLKRTKDILKEIIYLCYEIDSENFQQEIASLERGMDNKEQTAEEVIENIYEIQTTVEIFSDDVEPEEYNKIEELILELTEIE